MRYQVSSRDALLIELPSTLTISGDEIEKWGKEEAATIDVQNVDSRFWFCSINAGLPRKTITLENNDYNLGNELSKTFTKNFQVC